MGLFRNEGRRRASSRHALWVFSKDPLRKAIPDHLSRRRTLIKKWKSENALRLVIEIVRLKPLISCNYYF